MKQVVLGIAMAACLGCQTATGGEPPEELGRVKWLRDYDAALKQAKKAGKPILLLFQEVPG